MCASVIYLVKTMGFVDLFPFVNLKPVMKVTAVTPPGGLSRTLLLLTPIGLRHSSVS